MEDGDFGSLLSFVSFVSRYMLAVWTLFMIENIGYMDISIVDLDWNYSG